jgi:hypothetical protein
MTINDANGIIYVSITGLGFGNAEQMRKNAQHKGAHGTDFNADIDERLASEIWKVEKYDRPRIKYPDGGSREVQLGTLLYLNALLNWIVYGTGYDDITTIDEKNEIFSLERRVFSAMKSDSFKDFAAQYDYKITSAIMDEYNRVTYIENIAKNNDYN